MTTLFDLRPHTPFSIYSDLTIAHPVLRREAVRCLNALAGVAEGKPRDIEDMIVHSRRFLGLAAGYFASRRELLWPKLTTLFPCSRAEFSLLAEHSLLLQSDVSAVSGVFEELQNALNARDELTLPRRIALRSILPAKILHDSLSLNLGDEELVLRSLFGGLSRREIGRTRKALRFRDRFHTPRDRERDWQREWEQMTAGDFLVPERDVETTRVG